MTHQLPKVIQEKFCTRMLSVPCHKYLRSCMTSPDMKTSTNKLSGIHNWLKREEGKVNHWQARTAVWFKRTAFGICSTKTLNVHIIPPEQGNNRSKATQKKKSKFNFQVPTFELDAPVSMQLSTFWRGTRVGSKAGCR